MGFSSAASHMNLEQASDFEDFLAKNKENMIEDSLSEHLMSLLEKKGLKRSDVVRNSHLEKSYVFQIFSGEKRPSRDKLIAIAFGMRLTAEETQRMLKLGGCSELYPRKKRDALILFGIQHQKDIFDVDDMLDQHGMPTLLS